MRSSVPLPAPVEELAKAIGLPAADRSRIMLDIVRVAFDAPDGQDPADARVRARLNELLNAKAAGETAPLPLDPSIWRDTLLLRDVPDAGLLGAVLSERRTALLYFGLSALDDETLGWLGPERSLLTFLGEHAGPFAAFGRSLRVKAGRVVVPGGANAETVWEEIVGAAPSQPSEFARRLFSRSNGLLAFFYDTVAHLDEGRQLFALSGHKADRVRSLAEIFERAAVEVKPRERPFARQYIDPALTLSAIEVTPDGIPVGPCERGLWDAVFKGDERPDYQFKEATAIRNSDSTPIDAAWITSRIHRQTTAAARRRLDTFLFAQRVFRNAPAVELTAMATALRGMLSFPTLMLTLERAGVTTPSVLAAAASRANALNTIADDEARRNAVTRFQASLALIERMVVSGALSPKSAEQRIAGLVAIDNTDVQKFAAWVGDLLAGSAGTNGETDGSKESAVLAAIAGKSAGNNAAVAVEWEGQAYRVSAAEAELTRLRRVRERQGGPSLDEALAAYGQPAAEKRRDRDGAGAVLAEVLASIVYAMHLGEPEGTALAAGNVALRHDLGMDTGIKPNTLNAWRIAIESFGGPAGWYLKGSLLALDVPLARFALRRLDSTTMPPPPRLTSNERQTAALTVALMRPNALTDATRDAIAAALARGRARLSALTNNRAEIEQLAREAGLSEWRRESLAWTLEHDRERIREQLSLLELMWIGRPASVQAAALNAWGAAITPLTGCLCLEMPSPAPWEGLAGRPAAGLLAARGADVAVFVADGLSKLRLPASLAQGIIAFAMQDVLDGAQPAYFDDWTQFGHAALMLPPERLVDYVAALTAGGPLVPAPIRRE